MADYSERGDGQRVPWRMIGWSIAALLLAAPMIAMQFTSEVNWGIEDFVFAGIMIVGTGLLLEAAVRMSTSGSYRLGAALALAISFLLIWVNLAVGIIGSEDNPLNLLYGAVIGTAFIGAVLARFRARGMRLAMIAAAAAQVAVAIVAQVEGHFTWVITAALVSLWLVAAALFGKAAADRENAPAAA